MSQSFTDRASESYAVGFESLQQRFAGRIEVITTDVDYAHIDPSKLTANDDVSRAGFRDISAPAAELTPLIGRIVLYPNRRSQTYQPAVITSGKNLQLTVLEQPYDPKVGISNGMLFALGLKHDTQQASFGAHTAAQGFEAGHFAPAMIGARAADARQQIITGGDKATHSIGAEVGGVPEKMIHEGLLGGVAMRTVELILENPQPIPLAWHQTLERDEGAMVAQYSGPTSAIKLMLGAASNQLGPQAVEQIGELTSAAIAAV